MICEIRGAWSMDGHGCVNIRVCLDGNNCGWNRESRINRMEDRF